MDKETLSDYGWIVICVLVVAVMVALATPFGSYIKSATENTTQGLFDTSRNAVNSTGLTRLARQRFHPSAFTVEFEKLHQGEEREDRFVYGDYEYSYNQYYRPDTGEWVNDATINGFGVRVLDRTKTEYGEILETAYGYPITNLYGCFYYCTSLTNPPEIPITVTIMSWAFVGCSSLITTPEIPDNVTNMYYMFYSCTSLATVPNLPNSVTNLEYTFRNCVSITKIPKIPNSVTNMGGTFFDCVSLTTAPIIPNNVTHMYATFSGCTSLTTAPTIPSKVANISYTFNNCTSLTGSVEINVTPTAINKYQYCLKNTQITAVTGTTTLTLNQLQ